MNDVRLYDMAELRRIFGNVSRDTIDRKFAAGRLRRIKQGSYTYARSDDVEREIERLTTESERLAELNQKGQAA
jgi:hypothetical protein